MTPPPERPAIHPVFAPSEMVGHITNEAACGVITAFMIRGANHSYEVQWGIDKCSWHLDFELIPKPGQPRQIGFWHAGSQSPS